MTAVVLHPEDIAVVWVDEVGSDWLAIYKDGDRIYEGHPPPMEDAFHLLGIEVTEQTFPSDDLRIPGRRGFPLRLPKPEPEPESVEQ